MKKYCLALDLVDHKELIKAYREHHKNVGSEIKQSILDSGVKTMELYNTGNRLFMIIEVSEDFSFARKAEMDSANPAVREWESLSQYQQAVPWGEPGEKWVLIDKLFEISP